MSQKIVKITEVVLDFLEDSDIEYSVTGEQKQEVLNSLIGKFYVVGEKQTSQDATYIKDELEADSRGWTVISFKYETATYEEVFTLAVERLL